MFRTRLLMGVAVALALAGCRSAPGDGPQISSAADRWVRQGDARLSQSDFTGAQSAYETAIAEDPEAARAYSHLAYAMLFDPAKQPNAINQARQATEIQPNSGEAWAYLARALDWNGRFEEALEAAERAERLNEDDANVQSFLAEILADLSMFDQAIKAGEKGVDLDPTNAEAHRNLGYVYDFVGRPDDALAEYEAAYALEPEFVHRLTSLAAHYLYRADEEQTAREWIEKAEALAPDDFITLLFLARLNSRRGRYNEAVAYCERIVELSPRAPDGHNCLGGVYLDAGQYEEAELARRAAIRADPEEVSGYTGLGYVFYRRGECQQAVGQFERAVEIHPRTAGNHSNLGLGYACLGEWERAEAEYEQAIELEPNEGDHHILLGRMFLERGEFEQAEREFEAAIKLDAEEDQYVAWLGRLRSAEGDLEGSVAEYERASGMDPDEGSHDLAIGFAYLDSGTNNKEAARRFRSALDTYIEQGATARELAQASYGLALTYLAEGDCTEALPHLQEAARLDEAMGAAREYLAQCRQVAGFEGTQLPPEIAQRSQYVGREALVSLVQVLGTMGIQAEADYRLDDNGQNILVLGYAGIGEPGSGAYAQQQSVATFAGSLVLARTQVPDLAGLVVITLNDEGEIAGALSVPTEFAKLWELGILSDAGYASLWEVLQP